MFPKPGLTRTQALQLGRAARASRIRMLSAPHSKKPMPDHQPQAEQTQTQTLLPHSVFYRQFSKPFAKICLLSIGTYYLLHGLWQVLDDNDPESGLVEKV
ncbi:uncharacterized protein CANTADRAFT_92516 [Suhomyces tanzawaensis NRRL Y-17324]|uniref:Uncharacterized protein n=1 Tax=Suhomyces tanzawaensis NRRL Y-17324 TaxID=984487 RepID=A0A1E4SAV4_9ASCO|nr:uncharacterized protein CANTADRAFT_92516 [Suhomyces tanzawaensis NRRL Y-17324]ODV76631.1 hypothetical protein CANTADRAFT_92516 [Suhomyces tanzawaensis NRRL Y-17324]